MPCINYNLSVFFVVLLYINFPASTLLTELSGLDLFMADLRAVEAYLSYFYCLAKLWTGPLPEKYDPQEVADYFKLRPHVVAFRLLEVGIYVSVYHLIANLFTNCDH